MPNFDFLYYLSIFLALSREPRRGDFICCISLIIIILSPSCRLKMCFLNKKRIKIKNKNSILIQSKMALPNMWFEKIFANGNRKCDRWFNTLQRQREKRMMRNWAAPSPTRAPSTSTCQDVKQSFWTCKSPTPSFSSSSRKKLKTSVNKSFFRHRPQHLYLVVLHRVDKLVVAALQKSS